MSHSCSPHTLHIEELIKKLNHQFRSSHQREKHQGFCSFVDSSKSNKTHQNCLIKEKDKIRFISTNKPISDKHPAVVFPFSSYCYVYNVVISRYTYTFVES